MSMFTDLLSDFRSEKRFLMVAEPYDLDAGATVVLRYSSNGFNTAPSDTPSSTHYAGRIKQAPTFQRAMFDQGKLSGRSVPGSGTLVLANDDGVLDGLLEYAWGGRRVRVWLGGAGFALPDYGLIFDGTAQGTPEADNSEITINLRDLSYVFDREIQSAKFLGTGGAEGGPDVKDKRKPRPYGICRNVSPIFLGADTGKNLFAVADGAIVGILRVCDQGIPLTFTTGTPTAGQWSADLATGVITLGGSFVGPLTCDVIGRRYLSATSSSSVAIGTGSKSFTVSAALALAAGMRVRVARTSALSGVWMDGVVASYSGTTLAVTVDGTLGSGTYTDWTISPWGTAAGVARAIGASMGVTAFDDPSFSALDAAQPATVGLWVAEGGNAGGLLDALMNGVSGHWGFTRSGAFQVGRLGLPGTPSMSLTSVEMLEPGPERRAIEEPNHEVIVKYRRCWAVSTDDQIAGGASAADRLFMTNEWRQSADEDPSVLAAYPLSEPIDVEGAFDDEAAAAAEAARLLTMFGTRRDYFSITAKIQPLATDLGDTVTVTYGRNGLGSGKDFVVVDIQEDMTAMEVTLGLWG